MSATETKSARGWSKAKLSDLLTVLRGVTYKKEHAAREPRAGLLPILRANNIQDGLVFEDLVYVPKACVSETQMLRSGDIVIAASSGSRHIVGKAAQLKTDWRGSFGTFCFGLRPKPGVNPGYLSWFLQTSEYRHQVSELSAGVNINNLRATHIEEIPIAVAPPDEQRRIVAEIEKQFTRLEAGVAALRRVQANLKRYRAAVLKAACEGRLVPTEAELQKSEGRGQKSKAKFETGAELLARILTERRQNWQGRGQYKEPAAPDISNLPSLPEGWTWAQFGYLGKDPFNTVQTGPFGAQLHNTEFTETGVPVIAVGNLTGTGFRTDGLYFVNTTKAKQLARYDVWAGDLLFARSGATLGKVCVAPAVVQDWRMTGHILRARLNQTFINPKIAVYALAALPAVRKQVFGNVRGVTRPGFNTGLLESILIPVPPLVEQTRIVAEVERRLSVVEGLESVVTANLQRATRLRQSILQKAFTGEIL